MQYILTIRMKREISLNFWIAEKNSRNIKWIFNAREGKLKLDISIVKIMINWKSG